MLGLRGRGHVGHAGGHHAVEQLLITHARHFGQRLQQALADDLLRRAAPQPTHGGVGQLDDVVRPPVHGNGQGGLLEHARQLGALALGLGAGGLLAGLTFAQGLVYHRAGPVAAVGEAHQQAVFEPGGVGANDDVVAVGLVKLVDQRRGAGPIRIVEEGERAIGRGAWPLLQVASGGLRGQPQQALGGGVKVGKLKINHLTGRSEYRRVVHDAVRQQG